jgi:hypothetical protein
MDHQHRLRDSNWQIPRVLVNLCFWQDLIRKPPRGPIRQKKLWNFATGTAWEGSRRLSTEAGLDPLTCGVGRPHMEAVGPMGPPCQPPIVMLVLYCLLGCISAVLSSRLDPRAKDWCSRLYIPACTPRLEAKSDLESWEARNPNSICSLGSRASNQYKISPL